jgi:hypothetical protein
MQPDYALYRSSYNNISENYRQTLKTLNRYKETPLEYLKLLVRIKDYNLVAALDYMLEYGLSYRKQVRIAKLAATVDM